jgi:hypothetical protein
VPDVGDKPKWKAGNLSFSLRLVLELMWKKHILETLQPQPDEIVD